MSEPDYIAFREHQRIGEGPLAHVLSACKQRIDEGEAPAALLIFNTQTGQQRDFDFRGSEQDVLDRAIEAAPKRGRGRPKLGVTSKEVTLLPKHWEWLQRQGRSPSASLRRLVDAAMQDSEAPNTEAVWHVLNAVAGNLPQFEEVSRRLFRGDLGALTELTHEWPEDVRSFLTRHLRLSPTA